MTTQTNETSNVVETSKTNFTAKQKMILAICAMASVVIIVLSSAFATVAYLTSSAVVTNTFTIGKVGITLTESKVNPDGTLFDGGVTKVDANIYKLVPNSTYVKDPTVHVDEGSEDSYLFVLIRNDIEAIADKSDSTNKPTIAQQMARNGWAKYVLASTGWVYVYVGFDENDVSKVPDTDAAKADASVELPAEPQKVNSGDYILFEKFHIAANADTTAYGAAKITVTAVAIQDEGFANVDAAWEAVKATYPYIHTGGN